MVKESIKEKSKKLLEETRKLTVKLDESEKRNCDLENKNRELERRNRELENTTERAAEEMLKAKKEAEDHQLKNKVLETSLRKAKDELKEEREISKKLQKEMKEKSEAANKVQKEINTQAAQIEQKVTEMTKNNEYYKMRVREAELTAETLTEELLKWEEKEEKEKVREVESEEEESEEEPAIEIAEKEIGLRVGDSNCRNMMEYVEDTEEEEWKYIQTMTNTELLEVAQKDEEIESARSITVMVGVNHLRMGEDPKKTAKNLKLALQEISRRNPRAATAVVECPPLVEHSNEIRKNRVQFNLALKRMEVDGVVDRTIKLRADTDMQQDGFHIRNKDLKKTATHILNGVREAELNKETKIASKEETIEEDKTPDKESQTTKRKKVEVTTATITTKSKMEARTFDINNRIAAVFIGKNGKNLKRIEEEIGKGTEIIITNNNGNQQRLIVTTDQENIGKAVKTVEKNMSEIEETVRMSEQRQQQRKATQICREYLKGTCKRKDPECWFSHDVNVPRSRYPSYQYY